MGSAGRRDFREILYTVDSEGRRKWVYSSTIRGKWHRFRLPLMYLLMTVYLALPWLSAGGKQAVLLDIPGRKFTFLGATFWATDTLYLALFLGGLGAALFLFTAVMGRVWCGWACPETVFFEFLFRPLERLIEGSAGQRMRLDNGPWDSTKIRRKTIKYVLFFLLSWVLAATALAYFIGRDHALEVVLSPPSAHPVYFIVLLALSGVLLFQFGWFREQLCTAVCPYARFQSALLDQDSLVVAYDARRGEPRGARHEGEGEKGDCIDCGLCVRVCPAGIDIRNGLQLECIHCTACIDACDFMMEKTKKPAGLIRYDTEAGLSGGRRWLRPRVAAYALVLAVYSGVFAWALSGRALSEFRVFRSPGGESFEVLAGGAVSNALQLHSSNKSDRRRSYRVDVEGSPGIRAVTPVRDFPVEAGELGTLPLFITFPRTALSNGRAEVVVRLSDDAGYRGRQEVTLLGPEG